MQSTSIYIFFPYIVDSKYLHIEKKILRIIYGKGQQGVLNLGLQSNIIDLYLKEFINTNQSFHKRSICDHIWFQVLQLWGTQWTYSKMARIVEL